MAEMNVPYERRYTDAKVNGVLRRATNTQSVLTALGDNAPNLPQHPAADYRTKTTTLQTKTTEVGDLLTQLVATLREIDTLSDELKAANAAYLPALRGSVMGTANENLLDQITGPHQRDAGDDPEPPNSSATP